MPYTYKDATWPSTTAVDDSVVRSACSDGYGEVFGEFAIPFSTTNIHLISATKESPSSAPSSSLSIPVRVMSLLSTPACPPLPYSPIRIPTSTPNLPLTRELSSTHPPDWCLPHRRLRRSQLGRRFQLVLRPKFDGHLRPLSDHLRPSTSPGLVGLGSFAFALH
jgi:hypothetical protein